MTTAERREKVGDAVERRSPLSWSPNPPTEEGYYWWRQERYTEFVYLSRNDDDEWQIESLGDNSPYTLADREGGEWAGPLEPPP